MYFSLLRPGQKNELERATRAGCTAKDAQMSGGGPAEHEQKWNN